VSVLPHMSTLVGDFPLSLLIHFYCYQSSEVVTHSIGAVYGLTKQLCASSCIIRLFKSLRRLQSEVILSPVHVDEPDLCDNVIYVYRQERIRSAHVRPRTVRVHRLHGVRHVLVGSSLVQSLTDCTITNDVDPFSSACYVDIGILSGENRRYWEDFV
jgi:hypothetical protein